LQLKSTSAIIRIAQHYSYFSHLDVALEAGKHYRKAKRLKTVIDGTTTVHKRDKSAWIYLSLWAALGDATSATADAEKKTSANMDSDTQQKEDTKLRGYKSITGKHWELCDSAFPFTVSALS